MFNRKHFHVWDYLVKYFHVRDFHVRDFYVKYFHVTFFHVWYFQAKYCISLLGTEIGKSVNIVASAFTFTQLLCRF
jgi:hypothetical protein